MKVIVLLSALFLFNITAGSELYSEIIKSSYKDCYSLELTVYSSNMALVKDSRNITLPQGTAKLEFMDVASKIRPETVIIEPDDSVSSVQVVEQQYEYDLINKSKLLDRYVGKKIKLISYDENNNSKKALEAELLSNNDGPVYDINGAVYLDFPGYPVLPELPEDLYSRPTLIWDLKTDSKGTKKIRTSYITSSLDWTADYIMDIEPEDKSCSFLSWVTVNNNSGKDYNNVDLKLVAGDVNRVRSPMMMMEMAAGAKMQAAEASAFSEEKLFDYYLYSLKGRTDLKDKQRKQIKFAESHSVSLTKEYRVQANRVRYLRPDHDVQKRDTGIYLSFKNAKSSNLGFPLPAGTVRMYKNDSDGSQQFIGEDRIAHTPVDEEINLRVGSAFDIVCESRQASYEKTGKNTYIYEMETVIRNHKEEAVTVYIEEKLNGSWKILEKSHSYKKKNSNTVVFRLDLEPSSETVLTYKIKSKL